ncbi:MAG: hypothetical protein WA979_07240 [Pacificimonas sp.]
MMNSLRAKLQEIDKARLIGAALALTIVGAFASLFVIEYLFGYYEAEEEIIYFQSWSDDRGVEDAATVQAEERRMRQDAEAMADRLAAEAMGDDAPPADLPAPE